MFFIYHKIGIEQKVVELQTMSNCVQLLKCKFFNGIFCWFFINLIFSISGPNTGYEWNKEGRRSFPLLSRANAFTGFTGIANNAAEAACEENSRLPHPSETARQSNEEQIVSTQTVVMLDPDKIVSFFLNFDFD